MFNAINRYFLFIIVDSIKNPAITYPYTPACFTDQFSGTVWPGINPQIFEFINYGLNYFIRK